MPSFGDILKDGRTRSKVKDQPVERWGKCEICDKRMPLFKYKDREGTNWSICSECVNDFIKEEGK